MNIELRYKIPVSFGCSAFTLYTHRVREAARDTWTRAHTHTTRAHTHALTHTVTQHNHHRERASEREGRASKQAREREHLPSTCSIFCSTKQLEGPFAELTQSKRERRGGREGGSEVGR